MEIGSERRFDSYKQALEFAVKQITILGAPDPDATSWVVKFCEKCGKPTWGLVTTRYCKECSERVKQASRKKYWQEHKSTKPTVSLARVPYTLMSENMRMTLYKSEQQDKLVQKRKEIFNWNEEHTCPFADCNGNSVVCFNCMRGKSYAGFTSVSGRRCANNPISPTGDRYILRAKDWKDSNCAHGLYTGQQYDVADNLSEHAKMELVQRMSKVGRQLYVWSNGHVDNTPDPDSNS